MIVGVCGHGEVGASAVIDFLKGYEEIQVITGVEFQLLHQPDGINDLKYHLTKSKDRIATNVAIKRFKKLKYSDLGRRIRKEIGHQFDVIFDNYIDSIIQISWYGKSSFDPPDINNIHYYGLMGKIDRTINAVLRRLNNNWHFPRFKNRYFSMMNCEEFDGLTKKFLSEIFRAFSFQDNKIVLIDMLFSASNPKLGTEFFDGVKTIIVDRDPRDNYIGARNAKATDAFMPTTDVESFVKYYKLLREKSEFDSDALYIRYEDMIYDYYNTTYKIMEYIGIKYRPQNEFKYFDPDISVRYTNFKKRLSCEAKTFEYIEQQLPEYLYEFKDYIPIK